MKKETEVAEKDASADIDIDELTKDQDKKGKKAPAPTSKEEPSELSIGRTLLKRIEERIPSDDYYKRLTKGGSDLDKAKVLEEMCQYEVARLEGAVKEVLSTPGVEPSEAMAASLCKLRGTKALVDMMMARHQVEVGDVEVLKNEIVSKTTKWIKDKVAEALDDAGASDDIKKKFGASFQKKVEKINVDLKL